MKNTLEYKILKYLYENESKDFIEIIGFKEDFEKLNKTIKNLKKRKLIDIKPFSENPKPNEYNIVKYSFFVDKLDLCKIELEGIEYLLNFKKPILTLFQKLSIAGFIITFLYGGYQNNQSNSLENQQFEFEIELDSLKYSHQLLKDEHLLLKKESLKLKQTIHTLEFELNKSK